ncbi:uncharacterized protein LOC126737218 isoform X2 [Anthonomus grandis grandis]|uniref:uncharacterized protein LOC126737218 isoform X2 n=1 Tax=Anthonomus grandis grandis TaxID=2921223 RepID=UPI0021662614|nr:uncharacterized protein LOC126737218 isoform X2 [Anthonomus grandis grandis]
MLNIKFCGFLLFYLSTVAAEFFCYTCTGYDEDKCVDPKKAPIYNCYDELGGQHNPNIYVGCYSLYINYSGLWDLENNPRDHETGIYRGCAIVPTFITNYCAWHIAELGLYNITVNACASCNSDRCNDHIFDEKNGLIVENVDDSSGAVRQKMSWVVGFLIFIWLFMC